MGDLRRERDTARNRAEQLDRENKALRAMMGDIDPHYADAFALLCDIAHHGTKLDNPKTSSTFESQPPRHNPTAYHLRNEERRWQREQAANIRRRINQITGDTGPTVVPPTNSTRLAQPSRNSHSVTTTMLHSPPIRTAPQNGGAANTETEEHHG